MLRLEYLFSPNDREKYLENFLTQYESENSSGSSWIVSDLKLKFEIQERIIEKRGFFEDFSVLRVSELWNQLAKRKFPEIFLTSPEWIQSWLKTQLSQDEDLKLGPQAFKTVFEAMNLFYPIVLSDGAGTTSPARGGSNQFKDWLRENPTSLAQWGGWYLLAEKYILELLNQKKVCRYWIPGLLQNKINWDQSWDRPFLFDLGMQISMIEAELILSLSNFYDVTVLIPLPPEKDQFKFLYKPYDFLLKGRPYPTAATHLSSPSQESRIQRIRVPGILSEAKWSIGQIRKWIESGVSSRSILLAAPDIEQYWPILQPLLSAEGIPISKAKVIRFSSLPRAFSWLARLKISSGQVSYDQLELATYYGLKNPPRFEKFYSLFSEILGVEDLSRNPDIEKSFSTEYQGHSLISRDQFFGFSASHFEVNIQEGLNFQNSGKPHGGNSFEVIEWSFKEIYTHSTEKDYLKLSDWIFWLERILTKKEKLIQTGQEEGIHLTNISSADSLAYPFRIYLGLSENLLKKTHRSSLLSGEEVAKINSDIGFYFEDPDLVPVEFDLYWQKRSKGELIYSHPETGFNGAADSAISFWLAQENEVLRFQEPVLVWDSNMNSALTLVTNHSSDRNSQGQLSNHSLESLSVSQIEKFRDCPYILLAQKYFRQEDNPVVDLEVDRRTSGTIHHALFEFIIKNENLDQLKDEVILAELDRLKELSELRYLSKSLWQALRNKLMKKGREFIRAESNYRKSFPLVRKFHLEKEFSVYWDLEKKRFLPQKNEQGQVVRIKGRIDRIDEDSEGRLLLIDYKNSNNGYRHWNKWIDDNQLQLLIYMLAIHDSAVEEFAGQSIVGAFYYIIKNMSRTFGLKRIEVPQSLFEVDNAKSGISEESFQKLMEETRQVIHDLMSLISQGHFPAQPRDQNDCPDCRWRTQCRAKHLS